MHLAWKWRLVILWVWLRQVEILAAAKTEKVCSEPSGESIDLMENLREACRVLRHHRFYSLSHSYKNQVVRAAAGNELVTPPSGIGRYCYPRQGRNPKTWSTPKGNVEHVEEKGCAWVRLFFMKYFHLVPDLTDPWSFSRKFTSGWFPGVYSWWHPLSFFCARLSPNLKFFFLFRSQPDTIYNYNLFVTIWNSIRALVTIIALLPISIYLTFWSSDF